jgi:hypothetical protein
LVILYMRIPLGFLDASTMRLILVFCSPASACCPRRTCREEDAGHAIARQ